jgi:hypothetical protein
VPRHCPLGRPRVDSCAWRLGEAAGARRHPIPHEEVHMSEMPPGLPKHPIGTFAFVGTYAVVFVILWFAIYRFVFLARHPLTP